MPYSDKLATLKAELARLREKNLEDLRHATFVGWTPEKLKEFEDQEEQITKLVRQLASLASD